MKIVSKYHVSLLHTFQEISRQIILRLGRVRPGRAGPVNRSNDSASPKMVIQIYFNFFQIFLKVLELFEGRRGDPYMTANGNFYLILLLKPSIYYTHLSK